MDKIHSASAKNGPSLPYFCHPDVLVTATVSSEIKEIKMGKQWL